MENNVSAILRKVTRDARDEKKRVADLLNTGIRSDLSEKFGFIGHSPPEMQDLLKIAKEGRDTYTIAAFSDKTCVKEYCQVYVAEKRQVFKIEEFSDCPCLSKGVDEIPWCHSGELITSICINCVTECVARNVTPIDGIFITVDRLQHRVSYTWNDEARGIYL